MYKNFTEKTAQKPNLNAKNGETVHFVQTYGGVNIYRYTHTRTPS